MNPEIKAQWIAALRSGKYTQGQNKLHQIDSCGNHTYCCLGVLCELAVEAGITEKIDSKYVIRYRNDESKIMEEGYLTDAVKEWAGLEGNDPYVGSFSLATYNDGAGVTQKNFNEIADLIEEYL